MKKLLVLAAVAAMGAMSAKAEYDILNCFFGPASPDKTPATANLQYYQAYIIRCADGGEAALAYVQQQGLAGIQNAKLAQYDCTDSDNSFFLQGWGQYKLCGAAASCATLDIPLTEAYAVLYYGQDAVSEFLVLGNSSSNQQLYEFDDSLGGYNSGWQPYSEPTPTPEPTSGLLLLLGVAGLALKRKQA